MDGTVWNGSDPEGYARHFSIQRKGHEMKQAQRKQPVVSVDNAPRRSDYPAAGAGPAHHADRHALAA